MQRSRWIIVAATAISGGWMLFDGMRALIVGDYVTPVSGSYAGRLGPWAHVVEAVGLEPRSTPVKVGFVAYGAALLTLAVAFGAGARRSHRPLLIVAALGLWYLPFGTLLNAIAIVVLVTRAPAERSH